MADKPTIPPLGMTTDEFRKRGKEMIDFIADYYDGIEEYRVRSAVEPGYLVEKLPEVVPETPESWDKVMEDVKELIMPGVTHFQSPNMFAYFPANASYPAHLGEMLSNTFGMIGFNWINGPALTELEQVTMNWLREMLDLPLSFRDNGVIQGTASEATLVAVLTARDRCLAENENSTIPQLVGYCSDQAHTSYQKAFKLAGISIANVRVVETPTSGLDSGRLDPTTLKRLIDEDAANGLLPFFVGTTMGTTTATHYDNLEAVCAVTTLYPGVWVHVDAAYAGTALACPEFRYMSPGLASVDSFAFNPHKWMLVNFDCCAMWVKDRVALISALSSVQYEIYKNEASSSGRVVDYRDWQVPLGRRFRALKLWMVLRSFGRVGIQTHVRRHCKLALQFERLVKTDPRFSLIAETHLGLVCFKMNVPADEALDANAKRVAEDALNLQIIDNLNADGSVFLTHSAIAGSKFLRLAVCSPMTESRHIDEAWNKIVEAGEKALLTMTTK